MSFSNNNVKHTVKAGQDLSAAVAEGKAIKLDGTIAVIATAAAAVGVVVSKAQSGENVTYAALGHCLVRVGAAVNSGAALTIGASGFLTTYAQVASGALPVSSPVGRALAQAGSGDLVPAAVNFYTGGLAV